MWTLCVLQMDEFSVSERVALQLAGLQARVVLGPYEEGKESRYITMVTTTCLVCKYMFVNFAEKTNRRTHNVLIVMHPEKYFFLHQCLFLTLKYSLDHSLYILHFFNMDSFDRSLLQKDMFIVLDETLIQLHYIGPWGCPLHSVLQCMKNKLPCIRDKNCECLIK